MRWLQRKWGRQPFTVLLWLLALLLLAALWLMLGVVDSETYAAAANRRHVFQWFAGATSAAMLMLLALLMRLGRRLHQSERAARTAQAQFQAVVDGSCDISQHKQSEIEKRNSHHFLTSLIDHLPTQVYAQGLQGADSGRLLIWNKAAEHISGHAAHQVLGQMLEQVFTPKDAAEYRKFNQDMLANPRVVDIPEAPFRRPDGSLVYLRTISVPLFDAAGRPETLLGIAVDITEHRRQERELRTRQAELAAANDASPLGMFHTDANGHCTYVNRAYEEMSGLAGERALGAGWANSIHPQDRLKVFQAWGLSSRQHQPYQGTYRFVHEDGRIVRVAVKMAPILVDLKLLGYVGSVDDITARSAAETALRESEQHLRMIADALPALVAYVDRDECYRYNNLAYERQLGVERSTLRGKSIREVRGEALYQRTAPYIGRALAGETVTFEVDLQHQGRYASFEMTYTPQFDNDSQHQVTGFHVMGHDITHQKLQERRLVELAHLDSLTGLLNRAGFHDKLQDAMAQSRRTQMLMAVMYLDIDHFKQVNDSYGHPVGDALLKSFVARLLRTLRATDSVARLGGDEFTIIMEKLARPEDAASIANKIGHVMRAPFLIEQHAIKASISLGLAFYRGGTQDAGILLKQADDMLYQAKNAGRDTYRIAPLLP